MFVKQPPRKREHTQAPNIDQEFAIVIVAMSKPTSTLILLLLLALALPAHAERRISVVIPKTQLHVGESAKLPVGIPSPILIQMQTLDLTILYPQNIRITAVESVLPPGCTALVNTSIANTAHLSAMCANAQWLSGPLEWLTVRGMAAGKASLIMDCAFSQLRGTLADGYPAEIRLDCDGVAGVEVVP